MRGLARRDILHGLLGALCCAVAPTSGKAGERRIGALIDGTRALPTIAQRIDRISHALLGSPYRGFTLIGGPKRAEQFVVRDDVFDCVTFCETVLAAARATGATNFENVLRHIRYYEGRVAWRERNHYFSEWSEFNIANGVCRPVFLPGGVPVEKALTYERGLGPRHASFTAIPRGSLTAHEDRLQTGDIIGFLSERSGLDYFHTGFIIVDGDGKVWLRHASQSRGRVLDETLTRFLAKNGVRRVTLLRPQERCVDSWIV